MKNKQLLWIAGIIIAVVFISNQGGKEALLSSGYNVDADCKWATNVDPQDSRYTSYGNTGAWITIDANQDDAFERYGYSASSSNVPSNLIILVSDYNSYGDDIGYDGSNKIYVFAGSSGKVLTRDYGAGLNAIVPDCSEPPVTLYCGDETCNNGETCSSCAADCGACPSGCPLNVCNDDIITFNEMVSVNNYWVQG